MAPKASLSLLFHPKKTAKKESPAPSPSPRKPSTTAPGLKPKPKPGAIPAEPEEEDLQLPEGPYQEFKLMSSALNGWKYDVMKFDSRKSVDISRWQAPIKLNRKELRRDTEAVDAVPTAVGPMLGPDGKPVIGMDGKMVMVDAEGRPIHAGDGASGSGRGKGPAMTGKKRFQKKTRQVFVVPEEVRQLRREERYPWVMEDSSVNQEEMWIGQMEEVERSETHAFFMPAANDVFKFVPAHRWYKFQKKMKHDLPTDTMNVETLYTQSQKRDPQAWLASRNGKGPSAATAAMFKAEAEGRSVAGGLVHSSEQSLGPGGRKLKTVDSGTSGLFDEDEEGDVKRRREKEMGGEGDMDEQLYEEDFADDEEQMDVDENDEEAKELEERLKREYKAANKLREAGVDESDEEELPGMSKQAKAMQKLIRNREGNDAYESEEEENPYASSAEEEEEEVPVVSTEPAIQQQPQQVESRSSSQPPKLGAPRPPSGTDSRATSPAASPALGGHSIVAKRATSPKAPKLKSINMSRGNSPLGSRATSPVTISRATSPVAGTTGSRAGSPTAMKSNNKRKADDLGNGIPATNGVNGVAPKPKKRKALAPGAPSVNVPAEQLKVMLIEWLASRPSATTRECIHHFTPYLTDGDKKTEFSGLVREVAQLKGGVLVLRKKYQEGGSGAPSPTTVG
ncbi:transcription initiation factor [Lyophyllum atratum]|nr:transcription initiation factor [Lyophyllum atratum]